MPQQHFGSEPSKALRLMLAAVDTHSYNSACVFFTIYFLFVFMDFIPDHYGSTPVVAGLSKDC